MGDERARVRRRPLEADTYLELLPVDVAARVASYGSYINVYSCQEVKRILEVHPLPYLRINLNFQRAFDDIPDEIEAETCRQWKFAPLKELTVCFFKKINKSIIETISSKAKLNCFKVQGKELSPQDAIYASKFMPHAQQFHICHSEMNSMEDEMVEAIGGSLLASNKLENLLLSWTKYGPKLGRVLNTALMMNKTLKVLYLGRVALGDEGAIALAPALRGNTCLTTLNLRHNGITASGAQHLCAALKLNWHLKELFLNLNVIADEGAMALADLLENNRSLTIVQLCSNEIGSDGAASLGHSLKSNRSLLMLNMNNNLIKDKGSSALCEALKANKGLQELYLKNCDIGLIGSKCFSEALRVNETLNILDLRDNNICGDGGNALKAALRVNKNLQGISLMFNYISNRTLADIKDVLATHRREGFRALWWGRGHSACTLSFFLQYYG